MIPKDGASYIYSLWRKGAGAKLALCMLALTFTLTLALPSSVQAQHYEAQESDLTNPCDNSPPRHPLTPTTWLPDPCRLTEDNNPDAYFARTYHGGQQLIEYLDSWWETKFLPALKDLTKQLSASKVKQTLDKSQAEDVSNILHARTEIDKEKLEALRDKVVNDQVVISETPKPGLITGERLSNNLRQTVRRDISIRPESSTVGPKKSGPALDHKAKWDEYCRRYRDPNDNNGANGCNETPSADPAEADDIQGLAGGLNESKRIIDGDIDIEGFMFRDTIDLKDESKYKTSLALLQNIVQHKFNSSIPKGAIDSAAGRESILQQQHVEAVRNLVADVVAAILTRRAALILPDVDRGSPIFSGPEIMPPMSGDAAGGWEEYKKTLGAHEGSYTSINTKGCIGKYQFCPGGNLPGGCWPCAPRGSCYQNLGQWRGTCFGASSLSQFLNCPECQEAAVYSYTARNWETIVRLGLDQYVGQKDMYGVTITPSGLLAGAHLKGPGGPSDRKKGLYAYIVYNVDNEDAYHTRISKYVRNMGGITVPFDPRVFPRTADGEFFQAPSMSAAEIIRDIRKRAGVSEDRISANSPSYNESMLAMTKERFFDPEYFTKIREGKTSLQAEQASIDSYISMQYQDIYLMQEQINALLAARAALKINTDKKSSQVTSSPLK